MSTSGEVYQRNDGKWAWRITNDQNGQVVATDGSQGFSRKIDAQRSLINVQFPDPSDEGEDVAITE